MNYVLYGGLAVLAIALIWFVPRFVREYREVKRYMGRTKETGHMKSEIRKHRRAITKRSSED